MNNRLVLPFLTRTVSEEEINIFIQFLSLKKKKERKKRLNLENNLAGRT